MKWLLLCVLVLAGCHREPPVVDVDALNAVEQARLQAQADLENLENLEKLRKLK